MSGCPDRESLCAFADGEAGTQEDILRRHAEHCVSCRRRLELIRASKAALGALPAPAMPRDLALRLAAMRPAGPVPREAGHGMSRSHLFAALRSRSSVAAMAVVACLALVLWVRQEGLLLARLDVPADLLIAAHHQYALTLPLSPQEKILSEMPVRLAGGWTEGRDVY